ncbi:MAG: fibrobacter succinogenes major paralogous domain-containing protein [Fermentimonas sp.]
MKKVIINLFAGLILLVAGCTENIVTVEQPTKEIAGKTISVNAVMPGENTKTRMAFVPNELDVNLRWEENDQILLVFDDGINKIQQTVTIGAITNNGRTAAFEVIVPEEIINGESETFNLYGMYGGVTFSAIDGEESYVVLSTDPWSGLFLQLQGRENVLIRFSEMNIDKNSPDISVSFQHVGSLFKIYLENTGTTDLEGITGVELFSETLIFAHQNADPEVGAKYDLISGTFVNGTTFSNVLPFPYSGDLLDGDVLQLWGWYPPSQVAGDIWPAINLRVRYGTGQEYVTTVPKPARTTTTDIGKAYHFFARFNSELDPALAFSDIVYGVLMDERDDQIYSTVRIGSQTWMAENLRYFPGFPDEPERLNLVTDGSVTEPRYYIYGYDRTPESLAAASENFVNYGVLYNWPAAMAGATSSSSNPSGVQGVCPDGWHLPSEAEWVQLTTFVGANAASKLKETGTDFWNESIGVTNEYGFSARGGGSRQPISSVPAGFYNLRINGHWMTSTQATETDMRAAWMQANSSTGGYQTASKEYGGSVRCVKD